MHCTILAVGSDRLLLLLLLLLSDQVLLLMHVLSHDGLRCQSIVVLTTLLRLTIATSTTNIAAVIKAYSLDLGCASAEWLFT